MKESRPRRSRLRLDPKSYTLLRQQVLERDGWRCQYCGRREQLEGHHMRSTTNPLDKTAAAQGTSAAVPINSVP